MIRRYFLVCLSLILFPALNSRAQIVINEVSSASVSNFLDEDGDQEDWIEFYNNSATTVNLGGYTISSTEGGKTHKWSFPSINVKPHKYLTIFFSGNNRT